jgi:hypothetical protein
VTFSAPELCPLVASIGNFVSKETPWFSVDQCDGYGDNWYTERWQINAQLEFCGIWFSAQIAMLILEEHLEAGQ